MRRARRSYRGVSVRPLEGCVGKAEEEEETEGVGHRAQIRRPSTHASPLSLLGSMCGREACVLAPMCAGLWPCRELRA